MQEYDIFQIEISKSYTTVRASSSANALSLVHTSLDFHINAANGCRGCMLARTAYVVQSLARHLPDRL